MSVPALYIVTTEAEPILINVRVHTRFAESDFPGAGDGWATRHDQVPRLRFFRPEVKTPRRLALVVVDASEIYRVDEAEKPDGEFINAQVSQLSEKDALAIWEAEWSELFP